MELYPKIKQTKGGITKFNVMSIRRGRWKNDEEHHDKAFELIKHCIKNRPERAQGYFYENDTHADHRTSY